jgi:hypothetical protein
MISRANFKSIVRSLSKLVALMNGLFKVLSCAIRRLRTLALDQFL